HVLDVSRCQASSAEWFRGGPQVPRSCGPRSRISTPNSSVSALDEPLLDLDPDSAGPASQKSRGQHGVVRVIVLDLLSLTLGVILDVLVDRFNLGVCGVSILAGVTDFDLVLAHATAPRFSQAPRTRLGTPVSARLTRQLPRAQKTATAYNKRSLAGR